MAQRQEHVRTWWIGRLRSLEGPGLAADLRAGPAASYRGLDVSHDLAGAKIVKTAKRLRVKARDLLIGHGWLPLPVQPGGELNASRIPVDSLQGIADCDGGLEAHGFALALQVRPVTSERRPPGTDQRRERGAYRIKGVTEAASAR